MALAEAPTLSRPRREWAFLTAVIAAAAITYLPTFRFLWERWMDDSWPKVRALRREPSAWGLVITGLALALHLGGTLLDISGPSGVSVILCLLGGCLYFHGPPMVKALRFPLAYTVFMIPIPGGILDMVGFPLQLWASGATAAVLRLIGMEVARSGVNLSVPGFDFQVAQACSGMSSLVALVGVAAVFVYISRIPTGLKWVLLLLALPVALAANVVRITAIALVGYQWGPEAATSLFHDWSSPILFLAALCMLFAINRGLEWLYDLRTMR